MYICKYIKHIYIYRCVYTKYTLYMILFVCLMYYVSVFIKPEPRYSGPARCCSAACAALPLCWSCGPRWA